MAMTAKLIKKEKIRHVFLGSLPRSRVGALILCILVVAICIIHWHGVRLRDWSWMVAWSWREVVLRCRIGIWPIVSGSCTSLSAIWVFISVLDELGPNTTRLRKSNALE